MKTISSITRGKGIALCAALPFLLSSCYTVLKQSGEYYSEFDEKAAVRDTVLQKNDDELSQVPSDSEAIENDAKNEEDADETIVNNYYGSAYGGYYRPYSRWSIGIGYGYYPYYDVWYGWGSPSWDYYYWGGCYYPTHYGGYYHPYYPYYNTHSPGYPYARRMYGGRTYAQRSGIGVVGGSALASHPARSYRSGRNSSGTVKRTTAARSGRRQYQAGRPTTKARSTSNGRKAVKSDRSVARGFHSAARSSGSGSGGGSASRGSSGSGGGSRGSAPRSGGGGKSSGGRSSKR